MTETFEEVAKRLVRNELRKKYMCCDEHAVAMYIGQLGSEGLLDLISRAIEIRLNGETED